MSGTSSDHVYIFGAGASAAHGAPLTNDLLFYAFKKAQLPKQNRMTTLAKFLRSVFDVDPRQDKLKNEQLPSLVDVLSVIDMALDRKEHLSVRYGEKNLRKVREAINYAIAGALDHSLSSRNAARTRTDATKEFIRKLEGPKPPIISFNYDVILDVAIQHHRARKINYHTRFLPKAEDLHIDYGVSFANIDESKLPTDRFELLKLHGSLNWLWSPVTGDLYYGGPRKSVNMMWGGSGMLSTLSRFTGSRVNYEFEPILVTPTHLKDLRNIHLGTLWRRAELAIRRAKKITFIGYSLPSDDLHIKYLFKRAIETRRHAELPKITVVDLAPGRKKTQTQQNYTRFFGKGVKYYRHGYARYVAEQM